MSMRLQELHPALVHMPITLLPTSLAVDALGRVTGDSTLLELGRRGIAVAAGSALVSAVAGLIAQEVSRFDDESRPMLVTHRNLNLGVIGLTAWMATRRARRRRPSVGYLVAGLAGMAAMTYSAYLGGRMVYEHGVGVKEAGGLRESESPELVPESAGEALQLSGKHVVSGIRHAVTDLARGDVFPWLTRGSDPGDAGTRPTASPEPRPIPVESG